MTGKILGHYEVLEELGSGGMGRVYKAKDTHLDRLVAIKVLRPDTVSDPERIRRFVLEARAASALNHPNIVTIHDVARADGVDYIVMEYVGGRTLDRLIVKGGMKLADLLHYAVQAADALAKAHAAGIVHRDLKPSNIMVTGEGRVKILDFGLAKLAAPTSDSDETTIQHDQVRTGEGWVVGTPAYMSPEQAEGKPVDARSDIFSFGAVLYEMATGISPFRGESAASTLAAVLTATPAPPSQASPTLPLQLERVVVRCLRKDPSRRYQMMADLAVELDDIKSESSDRTEVAKVSAAPTGRWGAPHASRKFLWPATALGAVVIVATAVGLWRRPPVSTAADPPAITTLTAYQGAERAPSLSPDGTQVAFSWNGEQQNNWDVYIKPTDAVTPLRLTSDPQEDFWPAWSPSGRQIAFVRFQPDDRGAIYVTQPIPGSERKVGEMRVTSQQNMQAPSWTPDGKWLVLSDLGPGDRENGIFLLPVDAGERHPIVTASVSTVRYSAAAVSPSGHDLAYIACPPTGGCDMWLQSLGENFSRQGEPRRLTDLKAIATGIAWMPDGRSLVAGLTTTQGSFGHIWRIPVSGGTPNRLDWAGSQLFSPSVSQTGRRMAAVQDLSSLDLWRFDISGVTGAQPPGKHPVSSTLVDTDPAFSPDGTKIAFASTRSGQEQEIWVAGIDGSGLTQLTRRASGRNRGSPRWSHDGKRIVFDSSSDDGVRRAYVVDAGGGEARLASDVHANFPTWSPDDRSIYQGSNRSGRTEIWRVPLDGGAPEQVTTEGGTAPRISDDGRTLFYRRGTTLFAKPLAGGPDSQDRPIVERVIGQSGSYSPLGHELFYVVTGPDPSRPMVRELRATDVTTLKTRTISRFESNGVSGLTVSPNGKTVVAGVSIAAVDLVLFENFQ